MQNKISEGAHVKSKSGGHQMIVESKIDEYLVKCSWSIGDKAHAAIFHVDSLDIVAVAGRMQRITLGGV